MKKAKRLVSLLLAVVMLLSLAITAVAAGEGEASPTDLTPVTVDAKNTKAITDTSNLGVTRPAGEALVIPDADKCDIAITNARIGESYTIYQILVLDSFNQSNNAYSYKANKNWAEWISTEGSTAQNYLSVNADGYVTWKDENNNNEDGAIAFGNAAVDYIKLKNIPSVETIVAQKPDGAGDDVKNAHIKFTGLQKGYYLITTSLGANNILNTYFGYNEVNPKNSIPSLDKQVYSNSKSTYAEENSANMGEPINYRAVLTIPNGATKIIYHDNLSEGLTLDKNSIHIYAAAVRSGATTPVDDERGDEIVNTASKTYFSIKFADESQITGTCNDDLGPCDFHVEFTDDFMEDKVNSIGGTTLTFYIEYSAKLNDKATVGLVPNANPNDSKLSYGDAGYTTKESTHTYTFGFPIFKFTKEGSTEKPLANAKFKIIKSTGLASVPASFSDVDESMWLKFRKATVNVDVPVPEYGEDGNPKKDGSGNTIMTTEKQEREAYIYDPAGTITELVSGSDGYIFIQGVTPNTYRVYETDSPEGYNLLGGSTRVSIGTQVGATELQGNMYGHLYQGQSTNGSGVPQIGIENKTGTLLPSTGGIGTTIFYVSGSILLIGAAVLLIVKKRMGEEK